MGTIWLLVGAAAGCDLLIDRSHARRGNAARDAPRLKQRQKIAACGSSYRAISRKLPERLCLAEGLCHDDPTAG